MYPIETFAIIPKMLWKKWIYKFPKSLALQGSGIEVLFHLAWWHDPDGNSDCFQRKLKSEMATRDLGDLDLGVCGSCMGLANGWACNLGWTLVLMAWLSKLASSPLSLADTRSIKWGSIRFKKKSIRFIYHSCCVLHVQNAYIIRLIDTVTSISYNYHFWKVDQEMKSCSNSMRNHHCWGFCCRLIMTEPTQPGKTGWLWGKL